VDQMDVVGFGPGLARMRGGPSSMAASSVSPWFCHTTIRGCGCRRPPVSGYGSSDCSFASVLLRVGVHHRRRNASKGRLMAPFVLLVSADDDTPVLPEA